MPAAHGSARRCSAATPCSRVTRIAGPAIIAEANATTIVEPGWQAEVTPRGHLVLTRIRRARRRTAIGTNVDPVMLEIFNNLFMSIAEQMGCALENTAYSVNIKERLDFSCALFDAAGPADRQRAAHAGASGLDGRIGRDRHRARTPGTIMPGDVYVLNAPYNGGTHLPDITVITPVFDDAGKRIILFYVGSRGHHADIGGITPGSMPPDSRDGRGRGRADRQFHAGGPGPAARGGAASRCSPRGQYPARNAEQNIADMRAQIAANEKGVQELRRMVEHFGLDVVHAYMRHVQDNAEEAVRRVIDVLRDGAFAYEMDNGAHDRGQRSRVDKAKRGARRSTSPAPRRSCRTTSTRRRPCAWPRCSMSSARWSTTTSR